MTRFGPYFYPTGLKPEITCTFSIIDSVAIAHNLDIVLSSGIDRKHKAKSLHYVGLAVDISWVGFSFSSRATRESVRDELRARLGKHYDVVIEDTCIHIEYQPKIAVNQHWRQ
jgi:hypothetical protein